MSTVQRDFRFRHKSQALTLCDLYGRDPALKLDELLVVRLFWAAAGGILSPLIKKAWYEHPPYRQIYAVNLDRNWRLLVDCGVGSERETAGGDVPLIRTGKEVSFCP